MNASSRTPAIVGFLIAGFLVLAIGWIVSSRGGGPRHAAVPPLRVIAPASGDTVDNPVALEFRTPAALKSGPAGWVADDLHLHAMVDDREIMPAAADIQSGDSTFVWRLPRLETGARRIHLTWAGRHHGNLVGPRDTVVVYVRP